MRGHVEKRNGRWRARYRGPDGRERSRTFDRRVDAEHWITEQVGAVRSGAWVDPQAAREPVGSLGEKLLATKRDPNTAAWNRAMLRHVDARWQYTPVSALTHVDVQAWVGEMEAAGLGPDTVRGAYGVLHEVVALALRGRLIAHDPCLGVKLPKVRRREMLFLSPAQVNVLAEELERTWPGHGWGVLVRFAAERGDLPTAGGATLRFHDLRHTCAALLIGKGAQQYEVMEHLGHASIGITIDTYGHLFPAVRERIRAALEVTWDEGRTVTASG